MQHPDTLEALMMALALFLMLGGIFLIGHAFSSAIQFWTRHNRAIRAGRQATRNK